MSIYEFRDYKAFVRGWIESQPKNGRGLLKRMAEQIGMTNGMLSQIFSGEKHLSVEAAAETAIFLGLNDDETDYFLLLVGYARAGSHLLSERLKKKVQREQKRANELSKKIKPDEELPEVVKSLFYSHWLYTGIRNMTACPSYQDIDSIAGHLRIPRASVQRVVEFLLKHRLCVMKNGKLGVGPQITHVGNQTSLVGKHHQNWRLQGFSKMFDDNDRNMFFTSAMSLSTETADAIRQRLPTFIEEIGKLVGPSPSETVRCLNIDWFEY